MSGADVTGIAAGLTKAQRAAVLAARHHARRHAYLPEGYYVDADMRVRRNLAERGILRDYLNSHQRLTPLGLAVRAHLQENPHDRTD